jgi:cell wall-associated NlpC family hydrolase
VPTPQQLRQQQEARRRQQLRLAQQRRAQNRRGQVQGGSGGMFGPIALFVCTVVAAVTIAGNTDLVNFENLGSDSGTSQSAPKAGAGGTADGQKLLAEAVKFDNKAYVWGGGHPPTEAVVSRGVDCSGLVSVAVLRAFGINDDRLAEGFRRSPHWKKVDMKDARPGDIVYRLIATHGGDTDHVAFVANNKGPDNLQTFEAYGSNGIPYDEQVGYKDRKYKNFTGALRFTR